MPQLGRGARVLAALVGSVALVGVAGATSFAGAPPGRSPAVTAVARAAAVHPAPGSWRSPGGERPAATLHPAQVSSCMFNGVPGLNEGPGVLDGVTPGMVIDVSCGNFFPDQQVIGVEASPLYFTSESTDDLDLSAAASYETDGNGNLSGTFTVPNPFSAPDPDAVCPASQEQVNEVGLECVLLVEDAAGDLDGIQLSYLPPPVTYTGIASTPDGKGYWLVESNGAVYPFGDAVNYGSAAELSLNAPMSHIVATPDGKGYWLVAADGGTFAYGDAGFYGSTGGLVLNKPVVDIAPTRDGKGYWLVAADGGIFAFGDAVFYGSTGALTLNKPVVGMAPDYTTGGYWLVAADGGIFAFHAPFLGSTGNLVLNQPVNGMAAILDDLGYWFVAADGGVFAFGDAKFHGSAGSLTLNAPIVGMAADPATGGYWLLGADGGIFAYGAPFYGAGPTPPT